jgi:hypothetical protein
LIAAIRRGGSGFVAQDPCTYAKKSGPTGFSSTLFLAK